MPDDPHATKTPDLSRPVMRPLARRAPTAPSGSLAPPRAEGASPPRRRWLLPVGAVLAIAGAVGLGIWVLATMRP